MPQCNILCCKSLHASIFVLLYIAMMPANCFVQVLYICRLIFFFPKEKKGPSLFFLRTTEMQDGEGESNPQTTKWGGEGRGQ